MLRRETKNGEIESLNVEGEISYESIDGMKTTIPYNSLWKKIIVQVSGGLDSALLLYLVSKTYRQLSLETQIVPLSLEVPTKAKNLSSARAVIGFVKELTNDQNILPGLEFSIPTEQCAPPGKDRYFTRLVTDLIKNKGLDFDLNGNTKNPPETVRIEFENDLAREVSRDARTTIYNTLHSASPHALNNKKGIIYLYQKEELLADLAPLTLSCDMNLDEIEERDLPIPCEVCWWCRERKWGFEANGLKAL